MLQPRFLMHLPEGLKVSDTTQDSLIAKQSEDALMGLLFSEKFICLMVVDLMFAKGVVRNER